MKENARGEISVYGCEEPPSPPTVEDMRRRVRNHERVALAIDHLGATELGDAEDYVLQGIDALFTEIERLRTALSVREAKGGTE